MRVRIRVSESMFVGLVKVYFVVGFVFGFLFCFVLLDFTTNEEGNIV